jgi:glutamine amidotransferase
VFRYSSEGNTRTLFYSSKVDDVRQLYPDRPILGKLSDETRLIVSEPLNDLEGIWNEIPESTLGIIREGQDELHAFAPITP